MTGRINIISLDIHRNNPNFKMFNMLNADSKIDIISSIIEDTMSQLEKNDADAMNIFVWREYGISDADSKFVSLETKNELKKIMQTIADKHPSIVIIAGTVASKKHFKNYSQENWLKIYDAYKIEEHDKTLNFSTIQSHLSKAKSVEASAPKTGITVIRNSCLIFQKATKMTRIDKTIPHFETTENQIDIEHAFFRPGHSSNSIVTLVHPVTKELITVSIEICKDHPYGKSKHQLTIDKDKSKPLLQFVLSDHTIIFPQNVVADNIVHIDSYLPANIVTKTDDNISLHHIDVLNPAGLKEKKPYKSIFILSVYYELMIHIHSNVNNKDPDLRHLLEMERRLSKAMKTEMNVDACKFVVDLINQYQAKLTAEDYVDRFVRLFKPAKQTTRDLFNKLQLMVKVERDRIDAKNRPTLDIK